MTTVVRVPLAERAYDVVVGHGAAAELAGLLPAGVQRAAIVTQPGIGVRRRSRRDPPRRSRSATARRPRPCPRSRTCAVRGAGGASPAPTASWPSAGES